MDLFLWHDLLFIGGGISMSVADNYPKSFTNVFGETIVILNEECTCGRMITEHGGLAGHGASLDGQCPKFTWSRWITEEE